jgi:hypothetical protein
MGSVQQPHSSKGEQEPDHGILRNFNQTFTVSMIGTEKFKSKLCFIWHGLLGKSRRTLVPQNM